VSRSLSEITRLFDYNRWANARVLDRVSAVDDEEYGRAVGGSFPSVKETLAHLYAAEWIWSERLQGRSPRALPPAAEVPTLSELKKKWAAVEDGQRRWIAELAAVRLSEPLTYQNVKGETWTYPIGELLVHIVNHSTYHRGQVITMLRQLGKQGISTDYLVFLDEKRN
jgi:uncharacterized damage-inducible protein DinB